MAKFFHLHRAYGSKSDLAKRLVVIRETGKYVGQGGRLANVRYLTGETKNELMLSIVKNSKDEEIIVLEETPGKDPRIIPDNELRDLEFDLSNFDY